MELSLWKQCMDRLEGEIPTQQFNTWIRPLQAIENDQVLKILAPNRFVLDWVQQNYVEQIHSHISTISQPVAPQVIFEIGSQSTASVIPGDAQPRNSQRPVTSASAPRKEQARSKSNLNKAFTFDAYIEGKSNQLARAATMQVAENPGVAYNPLFIYGGVGLGKTHMMHAAGHMMRQLKPDANVLYLNSERFVGDMVRAMQHNSFDQFKRFYRSVDALLIDDIQFFSRKERSQEEFFHTFNALFENQQQIILTCDRYPKEVDGLEERLQSRFGWGLTVAIEPPDLETRVAILKQKAEAAHVDLPDEVAFFIAQRIQSNVRELEGALRRVVANAHFTGHAISLEFAKESLRDLLAVQDKLVTIENIRKTVAEYYKIRVADLLSNRRNRSIARPRQMAMALSKELTQHSLPEIGDAFGGRDHTTVLHACRKIAELKEEDVRIREDYNNLLRTLSS